MADEIILTSKDKRIVLKVKKNNIVLTSKDKRITLQTE